MNAQSNYIFSIASILEEYLNHSQAYTMELFCKVVNPLSANPTKWSNTLKQFVGNLPTTCLTVFDQFVKFALKGLKKRVLFLKIAKSCFTTFNSVIILLYILAILVSIFFKRDLTHRIYLAICLFLCYLCNCFLLQSSS